MVNALITGTNKGLGLGLTKSLLDKGYKVFATCRKMAKAKELEALSKTFPNKLKILEVDVVAPNAGESISNFLKDEPIDLFLNNAGTIGSRGQGFGQVTTSDWLEVLQVNLIAPLLISQSIIENISKGSEKKMFFLSSKVGSIADNSGGGMYVYRSSKTALNQVVKSLSVDLLGNRISVVALHPGWVRTDMGGPNALISIEKSVSGMIGVISRTTLTDTGKFFNYDGKEIPW
jgi:NAD(P)-dependent dehydrogenase (short-subunit alcohol dehydrogenase family)